MKAVRVNANGKTQKNKNIPALSSGMVTIPIEYLHEQAISGVTRWLGDVSYSHDTEYEVHDRQDLSSEHDRA